MLSSLEVGEYSSAEQWRKLVYRCARSPRLGWLCTLARSRNRLSGPCPYHLTTLQCLHFHSGCFFLTLWIIDGTMRTLFSLDDLSYIWKILFILFWLTWHRRNSSGNCICVACRLVCFMCCPLLLCSHDSHIIGTLANFHLWQSYFLWVALFTLWLNF